MFGHSPVFLAVARVCQGLSGAVIGVLGLAMIADTARPEKTREYMAYGSMSFTWGMLTGPMIGGVLYAFTAFVIGAWLMQPGSRIWASTALLASLSLC